MTRLAEPLPLLEQWGKSHPEVKVFADGANVVISRPYEYTGDLGAARGKQTNLFSMILAFDEATGIYRTSYRDQTTVVGVSASEIFFKHSESTRRVLRTFEQTSETDDTRVSVFDSRVLQREVDALLAANGWAAYQGFWKRLFAKRDGSSV